jgi:hypothetical protein
MLPRIAADDFSVSGSRSYSFSSAKRPSERPELEELLGTIRADARVEIKLERRFEELTRPTAHHRA